MPQLPKRIDWALIRKHAWYEGVIAILMAPTAFPISLWYFESVMPVGFNFELSGWDIAGQLVLAVLTAFFATAAGVAIDIGLVRVATGVPTHNDRFRSLTFWVPVVFWAMACLITYDKYSDHVWDWKMTTFVHLAYPTGSMFAALYWSWSKDWVAVLTKPLLDQIEGLNIQLRDWFERFDQKVAEATAELTRSLEQETRRADENERLGRQVGGVVDQLTEVQSATIAELRATFQRTLADKDAEHVARLDKQSGEHHRAQQTWIDRCAARERELAELRSQQTEPGTFQFTTMREGIEHYLSIDDQTTNDSLALQLKIKPDQLSNFRTQVSQVRSALKRLESAADS
jgi:hypothetical protein